MATQRGLYGNGRRTRCGSIGTECREPRSTAAKKAAGAVSHAGGRMPSLQVEPSHREASDVPQTSVDSIFQDICAPANIVGGLNRPLKRAIEQTAVRPP